MSASTQDRRRTTGPGREVGGLVPAHPNGWAVPRERRRGSRDHRPRRPRSRGPDVIRRHEASALAHHEPDGVGPSGLGIGLAHGPLAGTKARWWG